MSDVARRPFVHCVTYGPPGSGKSTFAATWPKPMLVLQTDPFGKEGPYLRRGVYDPDTGQTDEGVPFTRILSKKDNTEAIRIEFFNEEDPKKPIMFRRVQRRWKRVREEVNADQWATVVVDGITFLELMARKHYQYVETQGKEPRRWYAQSTDDLEEMIMCGAGSLRCHVVVLAHIDDAYDEIMGRQVHNPAAPGRMRSRFGAGFPEMYVAHGRVGRKDEEPEYWLQTRTDNACAASSVLLNAPNPCVPHFEALWENFDLPTSSAAGAAEKPQPGAAQAPTKE